MAWQACPRVTLVTPASNRLKGLKTGDTAGRETGVGARQRGIKLLSGDARPGVGTGRRVPGLPPSPRRDFLLWQPALRPAED